MRALNRVWLACALSAASQADAATPQLNDYAEGISIEPQAGRPLIEVEIPDSVYRVITRADLGDVTVFNAEGM